MPCLIRGAASPDESGWNVTTEAFEELIQGDRVWGEGATRTFGDYELFEKVGEGGMGVVFRARKLSLKKEVAVKFIKGGRDASERQVAFFLREAELASQLDHPHIAPVFEVGEKDGARYLVMRYIPGRTLSKWMTEPQFEAFVRGRVELLLKIARAIQYAHQRGIIHRDLKPGNILIDEDGAPFVTDFGLARWAEQESTITIGEHLIGTPAYMSPEQIERSSAGVTVSSDVWSLGVMLWQLLAGRLPFEPGSIAALTHSIVHHDPPGPFTAARASKDSAHDAQHVFDRADATDCAPHELRDLESVVMRCLEKDPKRRYASAGELVMDLERWLRGDPVESRSPGKAELAWRWCRRHPAVAGMIVASAAALAAVAGNIWQTRVTAATEELRRQFNHVADMNLAQLVLSRTNFSMFAGLMDSSKPQPGQEDLRGIEWGLLKARSASMGGVVFYQGSDPILSLDAGQSGEATAILTSRHVRLLDAKGAVQREWFYPNEGKQGQVVFGPGGVKLVAAGSSGLALMDATSGTIEELSKQACHVARFSADGRWLAATAHAESVNAPVLALMVFDLTRSGPARKFDMDGSALAWTKGDRALRLAGRRGSVHEWTLGAERWVDLAPPGPVAPASIFTDGAERLIRTSTRGIALCLDLAAGTNLFEVRGFPARDVQLCVSRDGRKWAATTSGDAIKIMSMEMRGTVESSDIRVTGHRGRITGMKFVENDQVILTSSLDGTVRRHDLVAQASPLFTELTHGLIAQAGVSPVFSPDGAYVALLDKNQFWTGSFGTDQTRIWDLNGQREVARIPSHVIAWREPGTLLSWEHNGDLRVWDMTNHADPKELSSFRLNPNHGYAVDSKLVDDGRWVVSIGKDELVEAWNVREGRSVSTPVKLVADAVFGSSSTPHVVLASAREPVGSFLWDLKRGRWIRLLDQAAADARFTEDGSLLAVADWKRGVELFDVGTGVHLGALGGQLGAVVALAFTKAGRQLVTGSEDRSLMIWNVATRRVVYHEQLPFLISWISISPDSRWLVTGHVPEIFEGGYRIWRIELDSSSTPILTLPPADSVWKRHRELGTSHPAGRG